MLSDPEVSTDQIPPLDNKALESFNESIKSQQQATLKDKSEEEAGVTSRQSILKSTTNLEDKENAGNLQNVNFNDKDEVLSEQTEKPKPV